VGFFLVAPGIVAGVVPYAISRWTMVAPLLGLQLVRVIGVALLGLGLGLLLDCFGRFAILGRGTPAPVAAPERLVVSGPYRHVRNPMYVAVVALVLGQGLLLGQAVLLLYGSVVWLLFHAFVVLYEEPTLGRRFGPSYQTYRAAVGRWWPSLRPWTGQDPA
jgi:protein-S-isoprenylcysteine O-methyltransferase Ste14